MRVCSVGVGSGRFGGCVECMGSVGRGVMLFLSEGVGVQDLAFPSLAS